MSPELAASPEDDDLHPAVTTRTWKKKKAHGNRRGLRDYVCVTLFDLVVMSDRCLSLRGDLTNVLLFAHRFVPHVDSQFDVIGHIGDFERAIILGDGEVRMAKRQQLRLHEGMHLASNGERGADVLDCRSEEHTSDL